MRAVRLYRDGLRLGPVGVRWHAGVCSPERRTIVFLYEVLVNRYGALFACQVWRASIRLEVIW